MLGLDRDVVYVGQEAYGLYSIFARVLADAYVMSNAEFRTVSPIKSWPKEAYDAVIFNLPTDCFFADFEKYILKCEYYNERHKRVFELLMKNHTAKKLAVGLVRFPFISNYEFKELRHQLLDNELIESVICLPEEGVFADSKIKTAIVVLDFENKHSTVDFFRGEYAVVNSHSAYDSIKSEGFNIIDRTPDCFRATVGKDVLEYFDWRLVSAIYANPVHCADGENPVPIMELASIIPIKRPKAKSSNVVSYKCFSTLFYDVLCKRNEYVAQEISECNRAKVSGPCVLFCVDGESGKIAACIIREGETVVYDTFNVYALRPYEDKASLEYLAYKLVTSKDFNHYLTDCIEYYADDRVSSKVLLNASLPVNPDLGAQKQFVEEKLKKYVLTRDRTYNVIWASELWKTSDDYRTKSRQDKIISDVSSFGIRIISTPFTATQLSDELKKYVDDCSSTTEKADAVIVDADITYGLRDEEEYDGLDYAIELKDRYEGIKLPFYLFTDKTFEELSKARIKARRLEYFRDRYFCALAQDAVESLCLRLQDEMDVLGSWVAEMRSKYVSVFQAADRYDDGDIQRVLADALGEEFSNELSLKDTQDKFNKLRQLAEGLLDGLAKAGIVPALNFGAQVDFLVDGRFDDYKVTGLFYHLDKNIMPDALGVALRYFKQMVAAGSHQSYGENHCDVVGYVSKVARNSDLYKSVLYIFMDLLLWYDWAMDKAENDPEFLDGMFRSVPRDDEEPGVVSIDEYDGQLVCKHTRLNTNESSSVGVGDLVKIRRRKVDKWHPTQETWFVADPEDYYVVASDE